MPTLSDAIERYLKRRLSGAVEGVIEIRRSEVAEQFDCVPSQINYVLETRFTPQRGYYVESRRGGGGYIRIVRVYVHNASLTWKEIRDEIGSEITAARADALLSSLRELGLLSEQRVSLIRSVLRHECAGVSAPFEGRLRARLLRSMLLVLLHESESKGR